MQGFRRAVRCNSIPFARAAIRAAAARMLEFQVDEQR
jgi:hypothetical protein